MADLQQLENSFTYYQGWYGTLSENGSDACESFSLLSGDISTPTSLEKKYPQILKILETSANSQGQTSYIGTIPDGAFLTTQIIKELKCGHSYLIVLKKGTETIPIPQFTFATAGTSNYEYKIRATI